MVQTLPLEVTSIMKAWHRDPLLELVKNYSKISLDWHSITALVELWHPQIPHVETYLGLPRFNPGEEHLICHIVAPLKSTSILDKVGILYVVAAALYSYPCHTGLLHDQVL